MRDHRFKSCDPDQLLLLPPDLRSWLPEHHLAWFVNDMVDGLDLSRIEGHYDHLKEGKPGFHPSMMVKVLIYADCVGVPSSRQIEKKTYEGVAFGFWLRDITWAILPWPSSGNVISESFRSSLSRCCSLPARWVW